ncbi:Protein arginine N-methyltransferase 5 [Bonamia ostreae]|uniref:Protein arginine N-methyltransferase 5 n=1 Tax=Bonamia ostreae TaxID=126728 RepID=A0ABV2AU01_9EUKA
MCSDIRNLTKTKMDKFDLIVSELLGSFGDNELSPEIIQIAEKFLNKDGKIIPQKYTSFLAPVSDETLWNKIENINISPESPKGSLYEMAIVSNLYKKEYFSEPKECYEFCHPLTKDDDLSKYCKLSFTAKASNKLDGFAGFFSAVLFDKIDLSINPQNYTKNMMSWFPMFFPLNVLSFLNFLAKVNF